MEVYIIGSLITEVYLHIKIYLDYLPGKLKNAERIFRYFKICIRKNSY